jgi:tRNA (guanine-N7-)-methyltransferase
MNNISIHRILPDPDRLRAPVDWQAFFGNTNPVEMEAGFGKGGFLVESSGAYPDKNYLGIENVAKLAAYTADRLAKRNRKNVRLICADAHYVVSRFLPDACLSAVHVYFPDPWPKKRHQKRRLLTEEFLGQLIRVMAPGARLHFATDFEDYFQQVSGLFKQFPEFNPMDPRPWVDSRHPACVTNYEVKYRREGRPIYYALMERI